jgi:hypothetical protein
MNSLMTFTAIFQPVQIQLAHPSLKRRFGMDVMILGGGKRLLKR